MARSIIYQNVVLALRSKLLFKVAATLSVHSGIEPTLVYFVGLCLIKRFSWTTFLPTWYIVNIILFNPHVPIYIIILLLSRAICLSSHRLIKSPCIKLLCRFTFNLAIIQASSKTKKTPWFFKKESRGPLVNESK